MWMSIHPIFLDDLGTAMTFEAWILPEQQPGEIQYIAGLWGPNQDVNDQWVLYIQDNQIFFALSKDNSFKGDSDNTVAIATVPDLYTAGWRHIAAEWDAASTAARIYLDGVLVATATNPLYPLDKLHVPEDNVLPLQIGSCNGLYDNTATNRTFLDKIDEVRLWNQSLSANEIACERFQSLAGNEPGLVLYYRCNEAPSGQILCVDATGNDHLGLMGQAALHVIPAADSFRSLLFHAARAHKSEYRLYGGYGFYIHANRYFYLWRQR